MPRIRALQSVVLIALALLLGPAAAMAQNSVVPGVTNVPGAASPAQQRAAAPASPGPLQDPIGWLRQSSVRQVAVGGAAGLVLLVVLAGIFAARRSPDKTKPVARAIALEGEEDYKGPADTFRSGASAYVEGAKLPPAIPEPSANPTRPGIRRPAAVIEMQDGRQIPVNKNFASLGRSTANDIVLTDDNVSREHCSLIVNGEGAWEIVNRTWERPGPEGGTNPIEVNGAPIRERQTLTSGDVVRLGNIGHTRFTFRTP